MLSKVLHDQTLGVNFNSTEKYIINAVFEVVMYIPE